MKKTLIALAVLGAAAGVAHAQSNVTIYGIVDTGFIKKSGQDVYMGENVNKAKFADTGILLLLDKMQRSGARRAGLTAKLAGGAHMFGGATMNNDLLKVGERNVQVCREMLQKLGIPILAQDVLGTHGRTITFDPATGLLHIKTVGMGEKDI